MKRKGKLFIILILVLFLSYSISIILLKKDNMNFISRNKMKSYTSRINFSDRSVIKINDIELNILSENNNINSPILFKAQRYYIPLNFICNELNYDINNYDKNILIYDDYNKISLTENTYTKNFVSKFLRGNLLENEGEYYISISDIEEIFNLIAIFDFENKNITLLSRDIKKDYEDLSTKSNKIALIRLEDFTCGDYYSSDINQLKMKCLADFLYGKDIKFHISWIPRFKSPTENIDNDLITNNNIINAGFVNLIDYLINKGGKIGLHGYTHQYSNEKSGYGYELSNDINNTVPKIRAIIENGIDTASSLNIPIAYFETPHYTATYIQREIIKEYFKFIYEPFDSLANNIYISDDKHLFIPTSLGYVNELDISSITDGLNNYNPDILSSFYYHPFIEFTYIETEIRNNILYVDFDKDSPLQRIIETIEENGFKTIHIEEFTN